MTCRVGASLFPLQGLPSTPGSVASSPGDESSSHAVSAAVPSSCGGASAASPLLTPEQQPIDEQQQQEGTTGRGGEEEVTVVHNGMVITNVPASQVSKVRPHAQGIHTRAGYGCQLAINWDC